MKKFFITTGQTNAKYTLRMNDTRYNFRGIEEDYDCHVITLSTDYDKSVKKAEQYLIDNGYDLSELDKSSESMLRKITHSDPNILTFGKYFGMTVQDIYQENKQYLVWVANNMNSKKHKNTLEIIKELIKDELNEAIEKQSRLEQEKIDKEKTEQERIENLQYVGTVNSKIELTLIYKGSTNFETQYGNMNIHFFEDNKGNEFVWKTSTWLCDKDQNRVDREQTIFVKATLKEHTEYKEKKQNVLTRVKIIKIVS